MKSLLRGEQIREAVQVQTRYGRCVLYFTNFSTTLESVSKGLVLELEHESVLSFQLVDRKSLKLVWLENNYTYDLKINYEKPEYLANRFKEIQNDHIDSLKKAMTDHCPEQRTDYSEIRQYQIKSALN